jgi:circadian clock protein KaiC
MKTKSQTPQAAVASPADRFNLAGRPVFPKAPTGIQGLDEITGGGLPKGRPTLVCGPTGCGKTVLGMEFLVHGITLFDEPGVFMTFEETIQELTQNVASMGLDLSALVAQEKLVMDFVCIESSENEATGAYDLEGLFIRLGQAIDSIGAKRVVLDTVESLFAGLSDQVILRAELRRLFRWLKDKGVTAIVTGERGSGILTRQGLEEYVSDCVIVLDHRVIDQTSSRRLRILKYRGSAHGTNEYPFLIDKDGLSVLPITSLGLNQVASTEHLSTGVERLDNMLSGNGYFRGSSVLISGTAGTGKSSLAAHFVDAACRRGERALYFAFEESPSQIMRNMRSIGLNLEGWVKKGLLQFHANHPAYTGLEPHLKLMQNAISDFAAQVIVVDPLSSFMAGGNSLEVKAMCLRLISFLKDKQITGAFTNLTTGGSALDQTDSSVSSLIDTWIILRAVEIGGEINRSLNILKSRGMAHSNQLREFLLTDKGVELCDVYVGASGVLTGSARLAQEARDKAELELRSKSLEHQQLSLERKRDALEAQIAALRAEFKAQEIESLTAINQIQAQTLRLTQDREEMGESRKIDSPTLPKERQK